MQERGHQVSLVCPREAQIGQLAKDNGLDVHFLPIGKKRITGIIELRRWLLAHRPDVINTHSSTDSWLVALASRSIRNRPAIVRTRHISTAVSKNLFSSWLYTRSCDHLVTTGENLRQTLITENHFPPGHVTSVRTGIDLDYFKPADKTIMRGELGLDPDRFIIGIVATLRSWKGHRYLIDAFSNFSDRDSLLLVVGDGPQWDTLHEQVARLELKGRVIFTGRQSNIAQWMNALDVFCLPSYANEGVPQALMQSQACGIPAITTLNGSINEAIIPQETALVVEPENSRSLQNAIERTYVDRPMLQRMAAKAVENARQNFSRELMLDKMDMIFTNAIKGRQR
jgi:glycosyltransferase involved in cell wall biosynthesis